MTARKDLMRRLAALEPQTASRSGIEAAACRLDELVNRGSRSAEGPVSPEFGDAWIAEMKSDMRAKIRQLWAAR